MALGRPGRHWIWLVVAAPVLEFWVLPSGILAPVALPNPFGLGFAASVEAAGVVLALLTVWTIAALPLLVLPGSARAGRCGDAGFGRRRNRNTTHGPVSLALGAG